MLGSRGVGYARTTNTNCRSANSGHWIRCFRQATGNGFQWPFSFLLLKGDEMKHRQRRLSKSPNVSQPVPLTEAQTAFGTILGQCLAKEWQRLSARPPQASLPGKPN